MSTAQNSTDPGGAPRLRRLAPIIPLLFALPAFQAQAAAAPKVNALVKYKNGILTYSGKALAFDAGTRISVFDVDSGILLHSTESNGKGKFTYSVPLAVAPCTVRIEAGEFKKVLKVAGADKASCKTVASCWIAAPASTALQHEGDTVSFAAERLKSKSAAPVYTWAFGDGSATATGETQTHQFPVSGSYRVTLTGATEAGVQCKDDVVISVAPPAGTNPNPKVAERPAPELAGAMPKGTDNDVDAHVILPFEETGMQGGSQIFLPYNVMMNYNMMNAQIIQKVARKPKLKDGTGFDVFYSAASNPDDPLGAGSINSTSQNIFGDGKIGSNIDLAADVIDSTKQLPLKNTFVEGHDYIDAKLRKTEQWDRNHQPTAKSQGVDETGTAYADRQVTFTPAKPMAAPDQGVRGYADKGAGVRQAPGFAGPYQENDPQKMDNGAYPGFQPNTFIAQNIPLTNVDDQGRVNPYPLLRVEARDKTTGETVAAADAVYTTASETRCRECHLPGGIAANEEVWRRPVSESELLNEDGSPGPATGAGSFYPGTGSYYSPALTDGEAAKKPWPPAIHNRFDNKHPDDPNFTYLRVKLDPNPTSATDIKTDQNGLRTDRVKASRWYNVKTKATAETRPVTDPDAAEYKDWQLQIQLNFREASFYGDPADPVAQEKAAIFNTLVMHDYMVLYGPTPATGKDWPANYSTQVADNYADDIGKAAAQPMYFCSGHHQSPLKFDVGVAAKAYPTNRSDYSRAFHAFHGKMQVYKADVAAEQSADGQAHSKGELIRDGRGHPQMFGGRGWDSQHDDDHFLPLTVSSPGDPNATPPVPADPTYDPAHPTALNKPTKQTYTDPSKNNWAPELFPMHSQGELMLQFGENIATEDNCAKCHTGATEKAYRDVHHAAGLKCDDCHGDMLAVGNVYGNEHYNANLSGAGAYGADDHAAIDPTDFRRPWLDEPDCGSCHVGDGNVKKEGDGDYAHVFSAGVLKQAWKEGDSSKRSMDPMDARFAVMPSLELRPEKTASGYTQNQVSQVLFRKSPDVHGSGANGDLTCGTCHGGSHAIWPNPDPNANDNVTAKQLQGYDGNIVECSVCHIKDDFKDGLVATDGGASGLGVAQGKRDNSATDAVSPVTTTTGKAFLAGPHGMHPVNDPYWYKHAEGAAKNKKSKGPNNGGWHNDFATMPGPDGEDQCAACHGSDHKGTRLSRTLVDRELVNEKGRTIKVAAGTVIGCNLCHSLQRSFTGAPKPKAKDGGWPKAQMHMPPAPTDPTPGADGGGGHGGH